MRVGQDTLWLVKSDACILGPFSEKAIAEGIRSREFRPIDEVSRPFGRWVYIREEPCFAKAVEDARISALKASDETTRDGFTGTPSQTLSLTDGGSSDDLTEEISMSSVQEALFQSYDDVNKGGRDRRDQASESYTYDGDPQVEEKAYRSTRWVAALTAALIFLTLGYVAFNQFIARPLQSKNQSEKDMSRAFSALNLGDYEEALKRFRLVVEANPDDRSLYTQLGILEVQTGHQTVVGRRLLESVQNWVGAEKKHVFTGLGLAALREGQYGEAKEQFEKALNADPLFLPASINMGVTALYQNQYQRATNHFQLSIKDGSADGIDVLLLSEALLQAWQVEKDRTYLFEAKKYLDQSIRLVTPYQDHVLVAAAYISAELGDLEAAEKYLMDFNDRPLGEERNYKVDLFIHRDQVTWTKLNQWCLQTTKALDPKASVLAAEAKCLYLAGDLLGSSRKIDQAVSQAPREGLVQAVFADLLNNMNSDDRSRVAIEKALDFDKEDSYSLPAHLQADWCFRNKDFFCSLKYWQDLYAKDNNSIMALSGIAWSYFSDGHYDESKRYLAMAKRLRSNYVPLLRLQNELDKKDRGRDF